MTEFKTGDRVRIKPGATYGGGTPSPKIHAGKIGVIVEAAHTYQTEAAVKLDDRDGFGATYFDRTSLELVEDSTYIALYRTTDGQWIVTDHKSKSNAEAEVAAVKNVLPTYKATIAKVVVS